MNRRFPSDFFFPQKEQAGSKSEPEPDRSQDTTRVRRIGRRMYVLETDRRHAAMRATFRVPAVEAASAVALQASEPDRDRYGE
jgi:hypothetical protein